MQAKNPLFLNIDLTSNSPSIKIASDQFKVQKQHKHSASNPPQLFISSPQFQAESEIQTRKHTPTKSQSNVVTSQAFQEHKELSIQSRVTNSSQSPLSRKGQVLRTEPSYHRLPPEEKTAKSIRTPPKKNGKEAIAGAPTVKSFVKNPQRSYYYQIDQQKHSSNNSRSITPKSKYTTTSSPQYRSEKQAIHLQIPGVEQTRKGTESSNNTQIKIFIRVKPTQTQAKNPIRILNGRSVVINCNDDLIRTFEFNRVLESVTQQQVYQESSKPIVDKAIQGNGNGVIFTYGQTGSGKTYTMGLLQTVEQGLVSLGLVEIFDQLRVRQMQGQITSYSIYMDEITDLLNPDSGALKIREQKDTLVPYIAGVVEVDIQNLEEGYQLIDAGIKHRIVASQSLNKNSSRSHTILVFTIRQETVYAEELESKVTFIDLAGSERIKKTNSKGLRIEEAKAINTSLSALGNVIQALGNPLSQHIPFRDSKLTRILQAYMDGGSSVSLICTISQNQDNVNETLSTLMFAQRCRDVVLKPNFQTNQSPSPMNEKEIEYTRRIQSLEAQITQLTDNQKSKVLYQEKKQQEEETQANLLTYLIKIIIKVKEYTTNVMEAIGKEAERSESQFEQWLQDNGVKQQEVLEEESISQFNQLIQSMHSMQNDVLSQSGKLDAQQIVQQPQEEIVQTIQQVSKSLLSDINNMQKLLKTQSAQFTKSVLKNLTMSQSKPQIVTVSTTQWDHYIAFLIAQGVNREKSLHKGRTTDRELKAKEFINQQLTKAQELFSIKDDNGEGLQSKNRIQSILNPKDEHSFSVKISQLRQFSNNQYVHPKDQKESGAGDRISGILKYENDKIQSQRFTFINPNDPPPIYHSPQDQANVSQLMSNKKQQSNLFNDISSLDNDRSDRQDNSKINLLESFQAQNLSKHLEMVDEEEEFDSKPINYDQGNSFQTRQRTIIKPSSNETKKPPIQEPQSDKVKINFIKSQNTSKQLISESMIKDKEGTEANLQTLNNQIKLLNSDERVGKSTIQTLAGRIHSKQASREYTNNNSPNVSRDGSLEDQIRNKQPNKGGVVPPPSKKSGTSNKQSYNSNEKDLMKILDDDMA